MTRISNLKQFTGSWFYRFLTVLLVGVMAIALTACDLAHFRTEAAQVPQLLLSLLSEPKTFNYLISTESPSVFGFIYEGLITENGLTGEIEPALAESWEVSEDAQRIVFTLREGLQWSDGAPLTADDVVFTYNELYFNEDIPTSIRDVLRIGQAGVLPTVQKLDQRRVEVTSPEPFAPLLRSMSLYILPAHSLRELVTTKNSEGEPLFISALGTDTDLAELVGSGPYQIVSYTTSQRIIFRRNPNYWRRDSQGNPQPYIERIVWQIVESTDNSLVQFRSGGLDLLSLQPDYFSLLKREEQRGDFTIYEGGPAPGTSFFAFNLNQGKRNGVSLVDPVKSRWFNTVEFRQAVAHAIDRQKMINNTFQGLGQLQDSPISVQSPYFISSEEGLPVYDYNLDKSRELLLNAGFQYNAEGQLLDAEGNRVRFTMITNSGNKVREAMGAQIKQDLSRIGIQVDFAPLAFNTLLNKLNSDLNWECYLLGLTGGVEPNGGANVWLTEGRSHRFNQASQPGQPPIEGRVVADWEKQIEQLYIRGAQTVDEAERRAIYAESQIITQQYLPFIYLVNPLTLTAVRDRIQNVKFSALGGALWNIHELEIAEN
ncbi:ABC transporter substrate-binding protein [Leptolyngbya sp. FACHB-671]|uniref:ABC transporter substrate-binding protein n=1 Tax=Leptolyngbya sp. FACHB-671 TaxID=2692812 RepID=UPI001688510C|nr:ABC transporter substrate-binding protein [Leptolyngbya sp. FACHB-671]MBD2066919.1 ABC transporter substrate-binding protein [Leptolyngbya sp. FACHB-671]